MEAFERIRHQYKHGDKVFCDEPNNLISKGVYVVDFESNDTGYIYLLGPLRGIGFSKLRFTPVNEPLAPPRTTATEVRAALQEKQAKYQQLVKLVADYKEELSKAAFLRSIFAPLAGDPPKPEPPKPDPFPGPPEDEPCEIRETVDLSHIRPSAPPLRASRGIRRGKLHDGTALVAALERSIFRASAHPPLHIPTPSKP